MFDELGGGDVIDQAMQQDPQTRDLTAGEAVKAMVPGGLGFVNQALYLVPLCGIGHMKCALPHFW
jgi:hypothetical protein